jgi:hypothetical protein
MNIGAGQLRKRRIKNTYTVDYKIIVAQTK